MYKRNKKSYKIDIYKNFKKLSLYAHLPPVLRPLNTRFIRFYRG
jgi:hypothetical protein